LGLVTYERIDTLGNERLPDICGAIAAGYPVCFGTSVSEAFVAQGRNDDLWFPPLNEPIAGGHALVIYGYDGRLLFSVKNSWGEYVGVGGSHRFSADYIGWAGTRDLWAVKFAPAFSS